VTTDLFSVTGRRVVVTGGSHGIGAMIAGGFVDAGARVVVCGRDADAIRMRAKELSGRGTDECIAEVADVSTEDGCRALADAVADHFDALDVLVNNGGATLPGGRDEWRPEVFLESLQLNLAGAMRLTTALRGALAASDAAGGASVVNLTSMTAFRALPLTVGYGSAKAGLVALTRNLATAWVADKIRVNAVAPGIIDTPMTAPMKSFPDLLADELRHVPMGRLGTTDEVVPTVLFLCSDAARYITGTVVAVDGGYLAI
jgi:3-oxoacyl-[acyl-carrier protein] reductase